MKIKLDAITPLRSKKTPEGRPIFSGTYEVYDLTTYLRLAAMYGETVDVNKEQATVFPAAQDALNKILNAQEDIYAMAQKLVAECLGPAKLPEDAEQYRPNQVDEKVAELLKEVEENPEVLTVREQTEKEEVVSE
jgi:hypothetical protein